VNEPRALIVFHTVEGQSARIAAAIAAEFWSRGVEAEIWDAVLASTPAGYDGVVVGDSIHAQRHSKELRRYLHEHHDVLSSLPLGMFQVSLTSVTDDPEHTEAARKLVDDLAAEVDLRPDVVGLLAGRLAYTQYGWLKRRLMRWISRREGGDTDMTRDFDYTNWDAVQSFADDVARVIAERTVHSNNN
jgi:menaquinone-dependent protoporphyrinogen oxidase